MKPEEISNWIDTIYFKENCCDLSKTMPLEFAKEVAIKFGQQCFNAARETDNIIVGDEDDLPGIVHQNKYKDFNDYLKQL